MVPTRLLATIAYLLVTALMIFMTPPRRAYACASCGSGGDDPLILYPNERIKTYTGFASSQIIANINTDGSVASAGGVNAKQSLLFAFGYGFTPRSFATLTVPYLRNIGDEQTRTSPGDPSLAGRYTVVMQSLVAPWIPQVQMTYAYKHAQARSLRESQELTLIDVFGSGFSEVKLGTDIWFGMTRVKPGISMQVIKPLAEEFHGVAYEPGLVTRATLSLGYAVIEAWRLTAGINRDQRGLIRVDGETKTGTEELNHSVFLSSDYMLDADATIRLSLARQAAVFDNYNTAKLDTVSAAYMRTF